MFIRKQYLFRNRALIWPHKAFWLIWLPYAVGWFSHAIGDGVIPTNFIQHSLLSLSVGFIEMYIKYWARDDESSLLRKLWMYLSIWNSILPNVIKIFICFPNLFHLNTLAGLKTFYPCPVQIMPFSRDNFCCSIYWYILFIWMLLSTIYNVLEQSLIKRIIYICDILTCQMVSNRKHYITCITMSINILLCIYIYI